MSQIICGISKLKKDQRHGSMEECAKKHQIRLYGIYKVDPKIILTLKNKKNISEKERGKLYDTLIKLKAKIKVLIEKNKTEKNKDSIKKEKEKIENKIKNVIQKIKDFEKNKKTKF